MDMYVGYLKHSYNNNIIMIIGWILVMDGKLNVTLQCGGVTWWIAEKQLWTIQHLKPFIFYSLGGCMVHEFIKVCGQN